MTENVCLQCSLWIKIFMVYFLPHTERRLYRVDKIWSKLVKIGPIAPTPPEEKFDFWTPQKFSLNRFQSIQRIRKRPPGHVLGLPRDRGQRNSPQKMKSFLGQNKNSLSGLCLYLKMIPKWLFRHAEVPRDLNEWKMSTSKFGQNWSKLALSPLPPQRKNSIFGPAKNFHWIGSNRFSVSENVPRDTF